jgi:N-acetylglutamate synthase
MNFTIEVMKITDYDAVIALWTATEHVGVNEMDTRPYIEAYLKRNSGMSFVARAADGRIVGAVLSGHDGRRGYLHHLAVAKDSRKQGIARRLVAACLDALAKDGMLKCNLFVYAHNPEGQAFWKNAGWDPRSHLLVMTKATQ